MINNNESRNPNLNIINVELNTSDQDLLYRITSGIIFQNTNSKYLLNPTYLFNVNIFCYFRS